MSQQPNQHRCTPVQHPTAAPQANPQVASQQVAPHLLGFINNPTLASAVSAAPLYPSITMLNNPDALIGMPGMYPGQHSVQGGSVLVPNMMENQNGYSNQLQQQQQQYLQQVLPNVSQHQHIAPNAGTAQQMISQNYSFQVPVPTTLGGVPIPPLPPQPSTAMQVKVAAAAAAAAAAPMKNSGQQIDDKGKGLKAELTPQEKARQNRDRNREHARSTRLRKKAYVQKLKELVEGLHVERTEEVRKRRVAIQHLSELQGVRRAVVRSFLQYHANAEADPRKWSTIIEDEFWMRQPVTPYRSFRRAEVEQECRISRGVESLIADAASVSVMVEGVGSRSSRWMQLKRSDVLNREGMRQRLTHLPTSVDDDSSQQQNGVSSLSSSSGSSNGSGAEDQTQKKHKSEGAVMNGPSKVSLSSGSSDECRSRLQQGASNDFHDYDAPALPDPMLGDSEGSSPSDSPEDSNEGADGRGRKHPCTDSSSGEEEKSSERVSESAPLKRRKTDDCIGNQQTSIPTGGESALKGAIQRNALPPNIALKGGISHSIRPVAVPPSRVGNGRLNLAPAVQIPPFVGIGKKPAAPLTSSTVGTSIVDNKGKPPSSNTTSLPQVHHPIGTTTVSSSSTCNGGAAIRADPAPSSVAGAIVMTADAVTVSSKSTKPAHMIKAYYHVNEDDMLLTEDNLMCPFIFRTQDAVLCGALSECVMPGMLRCTFSQRNKLASLELVYDAMGFMQQLERACGADKLAQVVPGSLEMALAPNSYEARVITLAKYPFLIVSVNEAWTRITRYTQMEIEGSSLNVLNGTKTNPEAAQRSGKPLHKFEEIAKGNPACSFNIHYNKEGRAFVSFVRSYPLTNSNDDVTHLLHVFTELVAPASPTHDFQESCSNASDSSQNQ